RVHSKHMQPAELGDLREAKRGVVDQPGGGRMRHQRLGHEISPQTIRAAPPKERPAINRASSPALGGGQAESTGAAWPQFDLKMLLVRHNPAAMKMNQSQIQERGSYEKSCHGHDRHKSDCHIGSSCGLERCANGHICWRSADYWRQDRRTAGSGRGPLAG